jgi:hypothetical protein
MKRSKLANNIQEAQAARAHKDLEAILEDAWLNLGDTRKLEVVNNLVTHEDERLENPTLWLARYIRQPENFGFLTKHIFGIECYPFQIAILQELWHRRFPMLIASRGGSKCIHGNELITTSHGFRKIGDLIQSYDVGERLYFDDLVVEGENGFKKVEYGWNNGNTKYQDIKT